MLRLAMVAAVFALLAPGAGKRKPKDPSLLKIEVIEVAGRRTPDGRVEMDGRIRNSGQRDIENLIVIFHFRAPSDEVITTQRGKIDALVLEPGEEAEFHWQMRDHARAVKFHVDAVDRAGTELTVEHPGPYPIE